jgi:nucleolar protein 53
VPAVLSRPLSSSDPSKRKSHLTHEEKSRLLRLAKRPRKGPFNSVMDPTEFGAGSAVLELSEAVKESGKYDPWAANDVPTEQELEGMEKLKRAKVKVRRSSSGPVGLSDLQVRHAGSSTPASTRYHRRTSGHRTTSRDIV